MCSKSVLVFFVHTLQEWCPRETGRSWPLDDLRSRHHEGHLCGTVAGLEPAERFFLKLSNGYLDGEWHAGRNVARQLGRQINSVESGVTYRWKRPSSVDWTAVTLAELANPLTRVDQTLNLHRGLNRREGQVLDREGELVRLRYDVPCGGCAHQVDKRIEQREVMPPG